MAKTINAQSADQPSARDDQTAPANSYGFSGRTVTVEFPKVKDDEPIDIFVGVNDYQARIKRGATVTIPEEVFEVIKRATYTDYEYPDESRPEFKVPVEKQRYSYNLLGRQ